MEKLLPLLAEKKLLGLYRDIEMPLVRVLLDMEWHGIGVDRAFLQAADVRLRGADRRLPKRRPANWPAMIST